MALTLEVVPVGFSRGLDVSRIACGLVEVACPAPIEEK
jgi:hypothetical protein